jgi:hypothetical protein
VGSDLLLNPDSVGADNIWGNDPEVRRALRYLKGRDDKGSGRAVKTYRGLAERYGRPFRGPPIFSDGFPDEAGLACDTEFILCFEAAIDKYLVDITDCDPLDGAGNVYFDALMAAGAVCIPAGAAAGHLYCKYIPGGPYTKMIGSGIGALAGTLGAAIGAGIETCVSDSPRTSCLNTRKANLAGAVIRCLNKRRACRLAAASGQREQADSE